MPIETYTPPLQIITQKFFPIFFFFFHLRCILLHISHKKCFFISISILGRSGVKQKIFENYIIARFDILNTKKTFACDTLHNVISSWNAYHDYGRQGG